MSDLRSCLNDLYLEVFPVEGIEDQLAQLPCGSYLGVTCSPKKGLQVSLDLVSQLSVREFHLVPHVAARQVRDRAHLIDIVQQFDDQGVDAMFVPGGDIATPLGDYDSSLSFLRDLADVGHRFRHVGVAAYPEGHPDISQEALFEALQAKQSLATYMVTQMCFDADTVANWLMDMRRRGISLPVNVGMPGVMDRMKLFRTSLRLGVGQSAKFLRRQGGLASTLLRNSYYQPDELLHGLSAVIEDPEMGVEGLYLFSFNQVAATINWQQERLREL
ncbi:MAG: methylenetetrahydrofolate reductase [Halioglobus sp.]